MATGSMLGKRKRGGRSTAGQGRKKYQRTSRALTMARRVNLKKDTHFFTRQFAGDEIVGNPLYAPGMFASTATLGAMPNVSEFTTLFDRYKITHWQLRFYLKIDPSAQAAATASYPRMFWIKDYDDATPPASLNVLREHANCQTRVLTPYKPIVINVKPAVLAEVYRSAVATTYSPKWNQWIDMVHTDIHHFGLKFGFDDLTNTNYKVTVEQKLWFQCKDTR